MLNKVIEMGRLTANPELKKTPKGTSVTNFCIAVERSYAYESGERETDFFNVVAWGGTAEFITRYFQKGKIIAITGKLQSRKWEDKDGNKRTSIEIMAETADFCGDGKRETQETPSVGYNTDINQFAPPPDDLPF